ncbi:MBL fold metallo-hydrolase [Micromonospora sp. NPDC000089]|uniref:MBL fold metallo-hydrolase n=1 Tax=unclassified Micromonospora TaxID=2617518 RepID=UPI00369D69CA
MLKPIADGVLVHQSDFIESNATVVQGHAGVLLVDPGVRGDELTCLANDLTTSGQTVVAGFSTHPDWDHLLWHARLGEPPRYATERCATAAREQLSDPDTKARITEHLAETEVAGQVPLDRYGLVTALPTGATRIPWDGPPIRIIEHRAHAVGHAALLVEDRRVLVAGDMLSDVLVPMLDLDGAADPVEDYLTALRLLEEVADDVDVVVPGHGSVGGAGQARERIERDRAYVLALRDGREPDDPRIGRSARPGWEWVTDVHRWQAKHLADKRLAHPNPAG